MKRIFQITFTVLFFAVVSGKILSWIFDFNGRLDHILSVVMFTAIGIAYLVMGFVWSNKLLRIIILMCGLFLIGMNFVANNITLDIIGIVCILTPMLIARFGKEMDNQGSTVKLEN